MRNLELAALAEALQQWGSPTVTGHAYSGEIEVLVTGHVANYTLIIGEPVVFVRDSALVPA